MTLSPFLRVLGEHWKLLNNVKDSELKEWTLCPLYYYVDGGPLTKFFHGQSNLLE